MFWTLEQALAWIMWRDESGLVGVGDGRPDILLPCGTAEIPLLSENEESEIVALLLERGDVQIVPAVDEPWREREVRYGRHEASGCFPWIEGWRVRPDTPLCTDGELRWHVPQKEPLLGLKEGRAELLQALRSGAARAIGKNAGCERVDLGPEDWLYADLRLSLDPDRGGYRIDDAVPTVTGPSRLRFYAAEIRALWPPTRAPSQGARRRPPAGAAAGKWYREDVIHNAARKMTERERKGRAVTDDDLLATLEDLCGERDEDGGPDPKTLARWVPLVRALMLELREGEG